MAFGNHLVSLTALHLALLSLQIIIYGCVLLADAQKTNFSFSSFSTPDSKSFLMVSDVHHNSDHASFLMNRVVPAGLNSLTFSCGRLRYTDRVRMKDSATGAVAPFHTAFTFQIYSPNYWVNQYGYLHADGLAFTFARNDTLEGQDAGSSLCLLQEENNGLSSNRVFYVEFDTYRNSWNYDPSDSHIGVNINSVTSTWYHNLCAGNVKNCSYLCNGGYFTAWIDYDSALQKLEVFFANGSLYNNIAKPPTPLINASLSLSELLDDYMYVGFSASSGLYMSEVHEIQSWQFASSETRMPDVVIGVQPPSPNVGNATSPASITDSSHGSKKVGIISGTVSVGTVAALLVVAFFSARYWKRTSMCRKQGKLNLVNQNLAPHMFAYKELSKATKNFSRSELLGSGGFGAVYKATLPSGAVVAVKRMRNESKHSIESFQAEVTSLSHIRHRNLVQLRGWCHKDEHRLLVYDYMSNGSLDDWLFQREGSSNLNYEMELALPLKLRYSILSGVAAALAYLHEECPQCVLHRDIKSSNVLLDGDWNAYLGDFGLARVIDHQKVEKTTMMAGTLGYMAPEMPHTGKATKESDVYSFGVLRPYSLKREISETLGVKQIQSMCT